jgi:hypothetical protein
MEACGVLLDVYLHRHKSFVDECRHLIVRKRFGLQPDAAASAGGSAEIDHERPVLFHSLGKGSLDIFSPLHSHVSHLP